MGIDDLCRPVQFDLDEPAVPVRAWLVDGIERIVSRVIGGFDAEGMLFEEIVQAECAMALRYSAAALAVQP
jgi:hypothetical protein